MATDANRQSGDPQMRPRRSVWQWALAALLAAAAVVYAGVYYGPLLARRSVRAVEPLPIRVSEQLRPSDVVPAAPGDLAGCNVLLVTFDTTRADRIGCYGNEGIRTPNLDALAREGVLFSNALAPSPVTLPSHATMMTGLYPFHHGARTNTLSRLDERNRTMAEILGDAGYSTAAVVSAFVLDEQFGIGQGFQVFDADLGDDEADGDEGRIMKIAQRSGDKTADRAEAWLRGHGREKFFLWVHFYDPHYPREAPAEFLDQYELAYDAEIAFADAQLGRLLDAIDELDVTERTLVVVAGDHGEGLGQHREPTHSYLIYDSTLHVPLIMRCGSRLGGGVHVDRPVGLIDILPTVLTLVDVPVPPALDGVALTQPGDGDRALYAEALEAQVAYGWASLLGVQVGPLKYIHGPDSELYDLAADPFERRNLIESDAEAAADMRRRLSAMYGADLAVAASPGSARQLSADALSRLRSLGYVGSTTGSAEPPSGPRPHPRDMIPLIEAVFGVLAVEQDLGTAEVITRLEAIAREHPEFVAVREYLGDACIRAGRLDEAEDQFDRCLQLRPGQPLVMLTLARLKRNRGDYQGAALLYRRVIDRIPNDFTAQFELGRMLLRRRRPADALPLLQSAMALRPHDAQVPDLLVNGMIAQGRADDAEAILRRRLKESPDLPMVRNALARLLVRQEQYVQAIDLLREGIALSPGQLELVNNLAFTLATCPDKDSRQPAEALRLMEPLCEATGYQDAASLHTLSWAYAALARFDEAISTAGDARHLALASGTGKDARLARTIEGSLKNFRDLKARLSVAAGAAGPAAAGPSDDGDQDKQTQQDAAATPAAADDRPAGG